MTTVVKVELAPTNGAQDASPTWVDISQYVSLSVGIQCNRGRGRTATAPEPGRLTLTLNNDDGRFTWGNPTGAYGLGLGDNAQLRQPIRVSVLVGEYDSTVVAYDAAFAYDGYTTVALWTGYVDEWVGFWENGYRPQVRVTASDRLARLALLKLDDGAIRSEILYDLPVAYYPLSEEAGRVSGGDQSGNLCESAVQYQFGSGGSLDFGSGSAPDGVGTTVSMTPASVGNGVVLTTPQRLPQVTDWTVEFWVRLSAANGAMTFGGGYVDFPTSSSARFYPGAVTQSFTAGSWVHIVQTYNVTTGTCTHYVNAASVGTGAGGAGYAWLDIKTPIPSGLSLFPNSLVFGAYPYVGVTLEGQICHVAVYDSILSAGRIAEHYAAGQGTGSFYGESASDRFERLCRLSGLPATAYATDATATTLVGAQNLGGVGMLDAIQQVTDSERGVVIVNGSGVLTYLSSSTIANLTADVSLAATDIDGSLGLTTNDLELTNDVTVTRAGGATQRRTDEASIAQIGANAVTVDTLLTTDAEAAALADLLLSQGLVIQPRTDDLTLDLAAKWATIDIAAVCALDTGSRATITGLPTGSPSSSIDVLVQGVAHAIAADKWDLTLTVTPALTLPAWELDDATLSDLGSTTRLGY